MRAGGRTTVNIALVAICLLLFMGGGLAVLLGVAALGVLTFPLAFVFFVLEVGLIATLQAFIFATLSGIYIGGAVAETH